jgi:peptide deformylase
MPLKYFTDPILKQVCDEVGENEDVSFIISEMKQVLKDSSNGVALGASQIGYLKRIIIVPDEDRLVTMINPRIVSDSGEKELSKEGCLSIPNIYFNVKRFTRVLVNWEDEDRNYIHGTFKGIDGHCVQHEVDHINGIMIFDLLPRDKRKLKVKKALRELKKLPV